MGKEFGVTAMAWIAVGSSESAADLEGVKESEQKDKRFHEKKIEEQREGKEEKGGEAMMHECTQKVKKELNSVHNNAIRARDGQGEGLTSESNCPKCYCWVRQGAFRKSAATPQSTKRKRVAQQGPIVGEQARGEG